MSSISKSTILAIALLMICSLSATAHERVHRKITDATSHKPVSESGSVTRTIQFPNVSIGGLYKLPAIYEGVQQDIDEFAIARGPMTVQIPKDSELLLRGNANLLGKPELLDALKEGAIDCIELKAFLIDEDVLGQGDRILSHVAKLTGLKVLIVRTPIFSDTGLSYFSTMKSLRKISASAGIVRGACFKDLRSMPELKILVLSDNSLLKTEYFHYLAQFPKL